MGLTRPGPRRRRIRRSHLVLAATLSGALVAASMVASAAGSPPPPATPVPPAAQPAAQPAAAAPAAAAPAAAVPNVLVYRGPASRQEDAVEPATTAVRKLGSENGFRVEVSEDPAVFGAGLGRFRAVVFLSATGAELNSGQLTTLQEYVSGGGGFVGIHDAARSQPDSDWFTGLIGTRPGTSPVKVQAATVESVDRQHPATRELPTTWQHADRWSNWATNPLGKVHTVAQVREASYAPGAGANGAFHPISWCRDYDGGRSFYTGMGATRASYQDVNFQKHLLGGIEWTTGMVRGDCQATIGSNYKIERLTAPNQAGQLDQVGEPHGLTTAPDGTIFYVGKAACPSGPVVSWDDPKVGLGCGTIHEYDPATGDVKLLTTLDVMGNRGSGDEFVKNEEGLLGIVADPDFTDNHWLYAYWMPQDTVDRDLHTGLRTISRFTYDPAGKTIDHSTRKDLLQWTAQIHSCCHAGGAMAFDKAGNLYVGSGDTNSSGGSDGYSGNNWTADYKGTSYQDARRTAGNTNDLNGKIIRIHPEADGSYTNPAGNLFTGTEGGGDKARPEIYVMGVRNISRLQIDPDTDWLTAAWVGPDASAPSTTWGPAKYETATIITSAGNQGWPYCMGNKQPYRDRSNADATQPADWYDCDQLKNTSPRNTGLVDIPPARTNSIWYSPQGGGPVYPNRPGTSIPTYVQSEATYTQPYFKGGGQAIMSGPTYRASQIDPGSDVAWPSYWEGKWLIGDQSNANNRVAVTIDPDRAHRQAPPEFGEDLRQIIRPGDGDDAIQSWMDTKFGKDGALYVLDYGRGFFSLDGRQKLSRITYQGGPATPAPAVSAKATSQGTPTAFGFSGRRAGGVSWQWDFGDGSTSTAANPRHVYTEGGAHQASLTVTYADGETATITHEVDATCIAPDARATVRFLDDDSGVGNQDVRGGCTVNDVIDDEGDWATHDEFVAHVTPIVTRLFRDGSVNGTERWALQRAAEASKVGNPATNGGYQPLFDGTRKSLSAWEQAPGGAFTLKDDGSIHSAGGLGMLWYAERAYGDYSLRLQFKDVAPGTGRANSGVFTRFPDPRIPLEQRPSGSCGTTGSARTSQAWVAIYCGQEIQIYDGVSGEPQKTGSIYNFDLVEGAASRPTPKSVWNDYEIRVVGQRYVVLRNGIRINTFDNVPGLKSSRAGDPPSGLRQFLTGYIGLQNHSDADAVEFRNIRLRQL